MWLHLAEGPTLEPRGQPWLVLVVGKVEWCPESWGQRRIQAGCNPGIVPCLCLQQCQGLGAASRSILIRINEMNPSNQQRVSVL